MLTDKKNDNNELQEVSNEKTNIDEKLNIEESSKNGTDDKKTNITDDVKKTMEFLLFLGSVFVTLFIVMRAKTFSDFYNVSFEELIDTHLIYNMILRVIPCFALTALAIITLLFVSRMHTFSSRKAVNILFTGAIIIILGIFFAIFIYHYAAKMSLETKTYRLLLNLVYEDYSEVKATINITVMVSVCSYFIYCTYKNHMWIKEKMRCFKGIMKLNKKPTSKKPCNTLTRVVKWTYKKLDYILIKIPSWVMFLDVIILLLFVWVPFVINLLSINTEPQDITQYEIITYDAENNGSNDTYAVICNNGDGKIIMKCHLVKEVNKVNNIILVIDKGSYYIIDPKGLDMNFQSFEKVYCEYPIKV